jgi:hypothetical protein
MNLPETRKENNEGFGVCRNFQPITQKEKQTNE